MFKNLLAVALVLSAGIAVAQQPAPLAVAPPEYILKVKPEDVDKIGKGLGFLPFNDVAPLMQALREQVVQQQQPKEPEKK